MRTVSRGDRDDLRRQARRPHVTIKDVAAMAGVSDTTVSLAFQPKSRIGEKTRQRVLAVAMKLHYAPNLNARALRMGGLKSLGFLVNDITNPFYALMVSSAESIALDRGYQVVAADGHWSADREVRAVRNMVSSRVLGMLICSCEKSREGLDLLGQHGVPCIAIDTVPKSYRGAFIGNDLIAAGRLAAEHLVEANCRRVAMLTADQQMSSFSAFQSLREGFLQTLAQRGIDPDAVPVINAGLTIDGGKYGFLRLMKRDANVDGVFCVNDLCAIGVIEAADAQGVRVGPDLAVMGIDNLDISAMSRISLTSIRQPYERIIELAVNSLIDGIETHDAPDVTLAFPPDLVVRRSTCRAQ